MISCSVNFINYSNTGGSEITRSTFNLWQHGKDRSDIVFKDLETSITLGAFNEVGGMKKSDIVSKYLIDFYVPFLPLEKVHVKLCIKDIIERNNYVVKDIPSFIEKVDKLNETQELFINLLLYHISGGQRY